MSREIITINDRFTLAKGVDLVVGPFIQLYDKEMQDDPSGEGIVLSWDCYMSTNYLGVNLKADATEADVMKLIRQYIESEGYTFPNPLPEGKTIQP